MELEDLRQIVASVGERQGWDFSRVRFDRDPVPWDYIELVRKYLKPTNRVLDIGTGGGENFIALAPFFSKGIGTDTDPNMISVARKKRPAGLTDKLSFQVMGAETLQFSDASFDVVLNRHAPVNVKEAVRVLRPNGFFITEQVGARNTQNFCTIFNCQPGGEYGRQTGQDIARLLKAFQQMGCSLVAQGEYDVPYFFQDIESLLFWFKAVPFPEDFNIDRHWRQVSAILSQYVTPRGVETNEHRELLIVRK